MGRLSVSVTLSLSLSILLSFIPALTGPSALAANANSQSKKATNVASLHTKSKTNISATGAPNSLVIGVDSKVLQAKAILDELKNIEHPEDRIVAGSVGWQEERRAATESNNTKTHSAEGRLTALGSSITPVLAEGLNSTNRDVTAVCATVLGRFGSDAVPPIILSMQKYGATPNIVAALKAIGSDSLPALVQELKSSDQTHSLAALSTLIDLTGNGNFRSIHRRSWNALYGITYGSNGLVFSSSAIDEICKIETRDRSVKYKEGLADLLGKIGPRSPLVAERLIALATAEDQPEVRESAICGLGNIAALQKQELSKKTVDILLNALAKDDFAGCRAEAASAFGRLPSVAEQSVPALADALTDGYPEVITSSVQSLSALGEKSSFAIPSLIKLAQNSQGKNFGSQAFTAIGNMKSAATPALPFLIKCLEGSDTENRNSAINAINLMGDAGSAAVPTLITFLSSSDVQLRLSAVRALGSVGPSAKAAVPALREIAQTTQDDRLAERQQTAQALHRITGEPITRETSRNPQRETIQAPQSPSTINFHDSSSI